MEELEALKEVENSLRIRLKANQREIRSLRESLMENSACTTEKATIQVGKWEFAHHQHTLKISLRVLLSNIVLDLLSAKTPKNEECCNVCRYFLDWN